MKAKSWDETSLQPTHAGKSSVAGPRLGQPPANRVEQLGSMVAVRLPGGAHILDRLWTRFYTRLLTAERGFYHCTGVDFSPASITWARQQARSRKPEY